MTLFVPSASVSESDEEDDAVRSALPNVIVPRSYQLSLLEQAKKENTIVYLETGTGKTHISVMLLQHYANIIRKPSKRYAVFLAPKVYLVQQQAKVIQRDTDLKVGTYYGDMNIDAWKMETWESELKKNEVFVMTPAILLHNLHHCFMRMDCIELLIFDECHHASKRHPYACIMQEFYHTRIMDYSYSLPRILGMTASPMNGKADPQGQRIEKELDKIEAMLHAKLHTVDKGSDFAPRPLPEFVDYEPWEGKDTNADLFFQSLLNLKHDCIKNVLGDLRYGGEMLGDAFTNAERKAVKSIEKLYNSLHYCGSELGIRCAYEGVNLLLRKYDTVCETEKDVKSESREAFLRGTLETLNSILSKAGSLHISSKVKTLINILNNYGGTADMRCIIFVERKIATRVLASLLSSIEDVSPGFRFQSLAGKGAGLNVMNRKAQQDVVESFRDGKVNVLVSTNVAEEGLDIQSCHLVIRFDLPKTPCSFIQSRGRARCLKSNIVYIVERENRFQRELLDQFKRNEESMKEQVLSKTENLEDVAAPETVTFETFKVESTGATITTLCSVSLLHQYCSQLSRDSYYNPMPEFTYTEDSWGVKCIVKLPTDALIQTAEGGPTSSRADARRIASLAACKLLYEAGALTDYLLLNRDEDSYMLDAVVPDSNFVPDNAPTRAHSPTIPDAFMGNWARGLDTVELHAYSVSFEPIPKDRDYVNFGLFLEADLGPEAGSLEVKLQLKSRRLVIAKCTPCGTMEFDPNQLREAKLFQERVFSAVLDHKPVFESSGDWSFDRLYLLLPLEEELEPPSLSIDWDSIGKVISDVEYYTLDGVPPEVPGSSFVKLYDGYVPVKEVTNSLVQTMHNKTAKAWLYCARELIPDLTAASPMVMGDPKYKSYTDYFEQQHNTTLEYVDQPMLEAKRLMEARNLLIKVRSLGDEQCGAVEELPEQLVQLPLELCRIRVKGLTCQLTNSISLLPSFMHRLEGFLLALQLRHILPLSPGASPVPVNLMLEAITTSKCGESFNLEGLELLGDAFIEVSVSERLFLIHDNMSEGTLSKLRTERICNAALEKLGRERGIMNYIRDSQFSPAEWDAPGRALELCADTIEAVDTRHTPKRTRRTGAPLQGKTIADVIEALIGAYYVHGGEDAAQAVMNWLGCPVGVEPGIKAEARARVHGQPELLSKTKVSELENLLNYRFENKGLLVEALTHASCRRAYGACYQRLEFLGDAVLDFLITRHFYESSEALRQKPGVLTDLRSAAVNNECFARVAARYNLQDYLLHNARELRVNVEKYVRTIQNSIPDAQFGWKGDGGPKVLSDLVESLAGAIFLDSDYQLDKVWNVFKKILRPLVTPETLRIEPTRELRELCQKSKIGDPKFNVERATRGDNLISVTIEMKGETIKAFGHKEDKHSAKKIAAIEALKALKVRGFEHSLRLSASYATKFSDLVDVPEEGCNPFAYVDDGSPAPQGVVGASATTPADVAGFISAVSEKSCNLGPCSAETTKKLTGKSSDLEFSSGSAPTREQQSYRHVQNEVSIPDSPSKHEVTAEVSSDGASSVPRKLAGSTQVSSSGANIDLVHQMNGLTLGSAERMDIDAQSPGAQHGIRSPADQHGIRSPGDLHGNRSPGDQHGIPSPADKHGIWSPGDQHGNRSSGDHHGNQSPGDQHGNRSSGDHHGNRSPGDQHGIRSSSDHHGTRSPDDQHGIRSPADKHGIRSPRDQHGMRSSGDQHGIRSPGNQHDAHQDEDAIMHEPPNVFSPYERGSSVPPSTSQPQSSTPYNFSPYEQYPSVPPPAFQPQPPPVMARGEARSLLNVVCMKHRWLDPVYSQVWKGGVSHAPVFRYMVQTTIVLGAQAFEIDVAGEVEKSVNAAKDSAAACLLAWMREQHIPIR